MLKVYTTVNYFLIVLTFIFRANFAYLIFI